MAKSTKTLLYLDEQKMYSLSSQIFEGFTDQWVLQKSKGQKETETQAGLLGSGRTLSDAVETATVTHERRFLHDWAYTRFEDELIKKGAVRQIDEKKPILLPNESGFVRVTGIGGFRDIQKLIDFVKRFNDIGRALVNVTQRDEINAARAQMEQQLREVKDRNARAKVEARAKMAFDVGKIAKDNNLNWDKDYIDGLSLILAQWFSGAIEGVVRPEGGEKEFVSVLNGKCLREDLDIVIRRYGLTESTRLTLFGTVVRSAAPQEQEEGAKDDSVRAALTGLHRLYGALEQVVVGLRASEVQIDPIAIYTEAQVGE